MSSEARCDKVRAMDAELALGVVDGEQRAEALEHLAGCESCRRAIGELSFVADELLLVAPRAEPPAGFESRVLEQIQPQRGRPRRRLAMLAGASLAVAVAAATVFVVGLRDGGESARQGPDGGAGAETRSGAGAETRARLYGDGDVARGSASGYPGSPSWLFVTVDRPYRSGRYRCEIVTRGGRRIALRSFKLDAGTRSWGVSLPVDLSDVAGVRLVRAGGNDVLEGKFETE
jgi:hypothetical protein